LYRAIKSEDTEALPVDKAPSRGLWR